MAVRSLVRAGLLKATQTQDDATYYAEETMFELNLNYSKYDFITIDTILISATRFCVQPIF